jgi:hypothetical protein
VRQALRFHTACLVQVQVLHSHTPLYRLWVWGQGALTLLTKGFMCLLNKYVPFFCDEAAQHSFDALKHALTTAPLLRPPNYNKDFLLYMAAAESTIGMVLVQEDDSFFDYLIYYLSRGLVGPELNYTHLEKLVLAAVHAVQRFRHYVLFRKTTVVAVLNPF